jgi:IS1 family transposase
MKVLVSGESKDCLDMSYVSVINWVKREALKIENHAEKVKKPRKIKVLELDEMCVNFEKTFGFLIDPAKHIIGKAHTFTVERTNRLLRHYIARFARKSYSVSKSFSMISNSILLFAYLP